MDSPAQDGDATDMLTRSIGLLSLVLLLSGLARAETPKIVAKQRFESGTKHFDLGEYQLALEDFKESYRLQSDPVFLYNIAQCYRLLKVPVEAVRFYRSYLRRLPSADNRSEVEQKIAALQSAIDAQERAAKVPPDHMLPLSKESSSSPTSVSSAALTSETEKKTPVYKKWWLWTAVVGGAAAIALGVGLGVGLTRSNSNGSSFPAVTF